ncbi:hypothetical protein RE432_02255 [Pusillimonas sp. SM2304]|uniref:hypothetical protein n=1 Tax=Pusillimonas sp. SM2304 TaxID=3073241 RepID=UPI002874E240|nr:hypothetical protein [Pusillimonas sp. SM2304]MDS1139241.1 hypothetical protein [Pusillimonas sp. SM2304]
MPGHVMRRCARSGLAAAVSLALAGCLATTTVPDPYSQYSPEDRQKILDDNMLRAQQHQDQIREQAWQDTITPEMLRQRLSTGNTGPVEGILSRGMDVFEGQMEATPNPYTGRTLYTYSRGSYLSSVRENMPIGFNGLYRGDFKYFHDQAAARPRGTIVMIGSFTRHDGMQDKGVYVAENAVATVPLHFVKATPEYLTRIEQRYTSQVARFREEQMRAAQEAETSSSFGPMLALGLGGLILSAANIPSSDVMSIGSALFSDVMTDGQSNALATLVQQKTGSYLGNTIGAGQGGNVVQAAVARATRVGGAPASGAGMASAPSRAANSAASFSTSQYQFSCPSGHSSSVPITYKTPSCLAAKQEMTRIYACNLVGEFQRVASVCSAGCGSPQCGE